MADTTEQEILYRVNNVYKFIRANEATQIVASYTVQDYIDQAILQLEGPTTNGRLSKKEKLKKVQEDLNYISQRLTS
jgi:hypothetical protein